MAIANNDIGVVVDPMPSNHIKGSAHHEVSFHKDLMTNHWTWQAMPSCKRDHQPHTRLIFVINPVAGCNQ